MRSVSQCEFTHHRWLESRGYFIVTHWYLSVHAFQVRGRRKGTNGLISYGAGCTRDCGRSIVIVTALKYLWRLGSNTSEERKRSIKGEYQQSDGNPMIDNGL
ncbi:hypothetical protein EVAR_6819_1 [Eumeta japonica]|uniref:Uncharacterized protein n=1 Tax=Eumeta variegata TaxID=151549 RepID=A0A4C1U6Z1_EUMVA|nr:hypothetical protein EVAR_6819_1 [Eumeta japonica]